MKTIYKLRYIALILLTLNLSSCNEILDDEVADFGTGPNLVGFASNSTSLGVVASGEDVSTGIPVNITGPSVPSLRGDIMVTIAVDAEANAETAKDTTKIVAQEGINYRLDSNTFTLSPNGSGDLFTGIMPVTIITKGLQPPLDKSPVLNLKITEISSNDLFINDKTKNISVVISYSCPFDINNFAGTYLATKDEFGIYPNGPVPFQVVVGPGENQITLVDVAAHPEKYDVVVDVDPATGDLTVPKQPALNTNNLGYTYGEMRWEGSGTSTTSPGNCIGILDITADYSVDAGSFGQYNTVFTKQ
jgi:hypothetical protein